MGRLIRQMAALSDQWAGLYIRQRMLLTNWLVQDVTDLSYSPVTAQETKREKDSKGRWRYILIMQLENSIEDYQYGNYTNFSK